MRESFQEQLRTILEKITLMGGLAEGMIQDAIRGLLTCDPSATDRVMADERRVNQLHLEIDEMIVRTMALQAPVAGDLRFVVMSSRVTSDVERIGDQAVNVVQNTRFVLEGDHGPILHDFSEMGEIVVAMVADALMALVTRDCDLAEQVLVTEKQVDALRDGIFRKLLLNLDGADHQTASRSISLILISRNLERIGDHASNIAEEVIYIVRGQDVRQRYDQPSRADGVSPL